MIKLCGILMVFSLATPAFGGVVYPVVGSGHVQVGSQSAGMNAFPDLYLDVEETLSNDNGVFHVVGTTGITSRFGSDSIALEILNGGGMSIETVESNDMTSIYGINVSYSSGGGIVSTWSLPNHTPLKLQGFLSIHGELAMGDTIDISFGGALGLHLTPSVGTDFLFRERFSTPGAFDFTFQYDNPEALFTNEYAYFPDFSLSGGVTVRVSHFGGGRTWFNIDPGVSATAVPELNSSVFVLVLNGTVMLLRRRSRKLQI